MKKLLLILGLSTSIFAAEALQMPPMPPMMDLGATKTVKENKNEKKSVSKTPNECELLPPMVVFLPPPMENMVVKCKNKLLKPKANNKNIKKLFGAKAKVSSIEVLEGFNNLYELKIDKKSFICNKDVTICFDKPKEFKRVK